MAGASVPSAYWGMKIDPQRGHRGQQPHYQSPQLATQGSMASGPQYSNTGGGFPGQYANQIQPARDPSTASLQSVEGPAVNTSGRPQTLSSLPGASPEQLYTNQSAGHHQADTRLGGSAGSGTVSALQSGVQVPTGGYLQGVSAENILGPQIAGSGQARSTNTEPINTNIEGASNSITWPENDSMTDRRHYNAAAVPARGANSPGMGAAGGLKPAAPAASGAITVPGAINRNSTDAPAQGPLNAQEHYHARHTLDPHQNASTQSASQASRTSSVNESNIQGAPTVSRLPSLSRLSSAFSLNDPLNSARRKAKQQEAMQAANVDIAGSLDRMESWPQKRKGYFDLLLFFLFNVLYIVVLALQLRVGPSFAIDKGLRSVTVNQDSVTGVLTQADFWDYFVGANLKSGLVGRVFPDKWYNGDVIEQENLGFVESYNKLIGGLLLVQHRSDNNLTAACSDLSGSSYASFYSLCFKEKQMTSNFTTANGVVYPFSTQYDGHSVFFGVAEGHTNNLALAAKLKKDRFTDIETTALNVKFAMYNGHFALFTFVDISFKFDRNGVFNGGNHVDIQSVSIEPYLGSRPSDWTRLGLEIVFMIWLFKQITAFIKQTIIDFYVKGFKSTIGNIWFLLDLVNLSLFILYIVLRIQFLDKVIRNPIKVPTNEYQPILEEAALIRSTQLRFNFVNIFIALLRCFKFYQFQERLNIINKTFANAVTDLYHYALIFFVIFGGYAVMAHFLFGPSLEIYSSMGLSMQAAWEMLLGNFNYEPLNYVNPAMAAIFFLSYMLLVFFVLINVLLAIIVDAYAAATADSTNSASIAEDMSFGGYRLVHAISKGRKSNATQDSIRAALEKLQSNGAKYVSLQDVASSMEPPVRPEDLSGHPDLMARGAEEDEDEVEDTGGNDENGTPSILADTALLVDKVIRENEVLKRRLGKNQKDKDI